MLGAGVTGAAELGAGVNGVGVRGALVAATGADVGSTSVTAD